MTTEPTIDLRHVRAGSVAQTKLGNLTITRVEVDRYGDKRVSVWFEGYPDDPQNYLPSGRMWTDADSILDIITIAPPPPTLEEHLADANRRLAENDGRFATIAEVVHQARSHKSAGTFYVNIPVVYLDKILTLAEGTA